MPGVSSPRRAKGIAVDIAGRMQREFDPRIAALTHVYNQMLANPFALMLLGQGMDPVTASMLLDRDRSAALDDLEGMGGLSLMDILMAGAGPGLTPLLIRLGMGGRSPVHSGMEEPKFEGG